MPQTFSPLLAQWRQRIETLLDAALPKADDDAHAKDGLVPVRLHAAMRHAVLNGGKRMRPLLTYATGHILGAPLAALDAAAVAVECLHCYSLVHDDLPAMDNDALRRGQPTVHVAFDEATAILAGDALQAFAFEHLATAALPAGTLLPMLAELARAGGEAGMCGGQALDMAATGKPVDLAALTRLHALKTGALLRAAIRLGALAGGASAAQQQALDDYADALGLAFQIRDDLLDIEGDSQTLGKTAGKDSAQDKATFPALIGVDASRQRLDALHRQMQAALGTLPGDTGVLAALAAQVVSRTH